MKRDNKDEIREKELIISFQEESNRHVREKYFHELMSPYLSLLLKRCIYKVKDKAGAEDLVQETLIRVYQALPKYRHEALFKTWLFTISDNVCYSFLNTSNKYNYRIRTLSVFDNLVNVVNKDIDLEIDVKKLITYLSVKEQEIIKLRFYKELSLDEISHILRITISACKMRLYRALQNLSILIA